MGFKKFRFNIIIRVVLLVASLCGLAYLAILQQQYIKSVYVLLIVVLQVIELIWYVDKTNRDLKILFMSILQGDYQSSFNSWKRGRSFDELNQTIIQLNQKFQDISVAKEVQYQFLETLIAHLQVALISFDEKENIQLVNQSAKNLLDRPFIKNLHTIESAYPEIVFACRDIAPNQTQMIKTVINGDMLNLAVRCSEFKLEGMSYKLVTLQNIKNEMEAQEVDSWQKLIRVLTHEIMNSVAPITSLSETLQHIVEQQVKKDKDLDWMKNLATGLAAIKTRSNSLHSFTQAYQSLTRLPKPKFQLVILSDLMNETRLLLSQSLQENNVKLTIECPQDLSYTLDKEMISQVLVNLIKNSIESLEGQENKAISIMCSHEKDLLQIRVKDNGAGIDAEHLEKIFIPFFTTKEAGSGIGLALSRQIAHLHNGRLTVNSVFSEGTEIILEM